MNQHLYQAQGAPEHHEQDEQGPGGAYRAILWVVLAIAILAFGYFGFVLYQNSAGQSSLPDSIEEDRYHAVFLTTNRLNYFAKVEEVGGDYVLLKDIYYLRVEQPIDRVPPDQPAQPEVTLVKRGNEIHNPQDTMYLNKEYILFIEPLRDNSNVVKAIAKEKEERENR